ncbi:MAG: hypothetical protein MHM6MM_005612, partial [Cercozoa sp. M6MM]
YTQVACSSHSPGKKAARMYVAVQYAQEVDSLPKDAAEKLRATLSSFVFSRSKLAVYPVAALSKRTTSKSQEALHTLTVWADD